MTSNTHPSASPNPPSASTPTHLRLCSVGMGGGAHGILLIGADALELVQRVVAELRRREEEARLQHLGDRGRRGRCVRPCSKDVVKNNEKSQGGMGYMCGLLCGL